MILTPIHLHQDINRIEIGGGGVIGRHLGEKKKEIGKIINILHLMLQMLCKKT